MKHKIEKYRIKGLAARLAEKTESKAAPSSQTQAATAAHDMVEKSAKDSSESDDQSSATVSKEGLTARQLRMARRTAQKHGVAFKTDQEAVEKLRAQGIDPFERGNVLDMHAKRNPAGKKGKNQLPQKIALSKVPAIKGKEGEINPAAKRAAEIMALQRDMVRRRRRNILLLVFRLTAFIFLPTLLSGYYFTSLATPMYSTKSAFQIIKADSGIGGAGGLLSGTSFATTPDAIAVQSYLESKEAMLRLDEDVGFKAHFSAPDIDVLQRLPEGASNEKAYKLSLIHI